MLRRWAVFLACILRAVSLRWPDSSGFAGRQGDLVCYGLSSA